MLPRKLHLEQINRFHNKLHEMVKAINQIGDRTDLDDHKSQLCRQYYELSNLHEEVDNTCERIKDFIDAMED